MPSYQEHLFAVGNQTGKEVNWRETLTQTKLKGVFMANYEKNLKPYSDLAHQMAQYGGPDQYLAEYAQANIQLGAQHQQSIDLKYSVAYFVIGYMLIEGGKWAYRKIKTKWQNRKDTLEQQSKQAEREIKGFA